MQARRGRAITRTTVALGLAVLVGAGFAAKDRIREEWWLHKLRTGDSRERTAAAEGLARLGSIRAVPILLRISGDDGKKVLSHFLLSDEANAAMGALQAVVSKRGTLVLPHLTEALRSGYWTVRWRAAQLILALAPGVEEAVPALVQAFEDEPENDGRRILRTAAHDVLVRIGSPAVPTLVARLQSTDTMNLRVARALADIGPPSVPALIDVLDRGTREGKLSALFSLFDMGHDGNLAGPKLLSLLGDPDKPIRTRAALALAKMGYMTEVVIPRVLPELKGSDYLSRRYAANTLGWMGPQAVQAIPDLVGALHDDNEEVRAAAAYALGSIGPDAVAASPQLTEALKDDNERVRQAAGDALARIQQEAAANGGDAR
jgi:HEAT repeat protein